MLRILVQYVPGVSLLLLPFLFGGAGCGTSATKDGSNATAAASAKSEASCCASHGLQPPPADSATEVDSDCNAELAKLPPEERLLAQRQKVCPVTGAPLGSMGLPFKVTVKGRMVFLCCGGCEEKLKRNVDKYLAKLDRVETKQ